MPSTALFVIDIQQSLAGDPKTRIPHATRLCSSVTEILQRARKAEEAPLLVFVQHEESPESGDLVKDTEPWRLIFQPNEAKSDWLLSKVDPSTFESNPTLAQRLKDAGVTDVVGCGIQSEWCVRATLASALVEGFNVTLLKGAHSTYDEGGQTAEEIERTIEDELKIKGAKIVDWEDWKP